MRKALSVVALFIPLLLRASGQFGISTPLLTNSGTTCSVQNPPGAPQLVQFSNSYGGSFNDTLSMTGIVSGHAVVVSTAFDSATPPGNTTVSDTFGNTWTALSTNGTPPYRLYVWVALNVTGGAGVDSINIGNSSVSWDSNPMGAEFSGVATSGALDGTPAVTASATLTWPVITNGVTTTTADDMLITIFGAQCGGGLCTGTIAACTFTSAGSVVHASYMAVAPQSAIGTFASSWTGIAGIEGARDNATVLFALKP